jgi:hypothetical protein
MKYKYAPNSYRTIVSNEAIDDMEFEFKPKKVAGKNGTQEITGKVTIYSKANLIASGAKNLKYVSVAMTPEMTVSFSNLGTIGSVYQDKVGAAVETRNTGVILMSDFVTDSDGYYVRDIINMAPDKNYDAIEDEIEYLYAQLRKIEDKYVQFLWKEPI